MLVRFFLSCTKNNNKVNVITPLDNVTTTSDVECLKLKQPPFSGTVYIDPGIITSKDTSNFIALSYAGKEIREVFDRRVNSWIDLEVILFTAEYNDGLNIEILVNPEFGSKNNAEAYALKYGNVIGRLTTELRMDVWSAVIHRGNELFGGGYNELLIHTDWGQSIEEQGYLDEAIFHEATHISVEEPIATSKDWLLAQELDCGFISDYAQ